MAIAEEDAEEGEQQKQQEQQGSSDEECWSGEDPEQRQECRNKGRCMFARAA